MTNRIERKKISKRLKGERLDQSLAKVFPEFSRNRLKSWILKGFILVDGESWRPRDIVKGGETIDLNVKYESSVIDSPQDLELDIAFEDKFFLLVNKPAGLVVHPGAGNPSGTLMNGLLYLYPHLKKLPRAGIIHRLDKDTSGLMLVAKTIESHTALVRQLELREISRKYEAVCVGVLTGGGKITQPIRRHPVHRTKMAVGEKGRSATTYYKVKNRFRAHTHIEVDLETGRTHQIRVHFAWRRHPLFGDPLYGQRLAIPSGMGQYTQSVIRSFKRQALCARSLDFLHPITNKKMSFQIPLAFDFEELISALKQDVQSMAE